MAETEVVEAPAAAATPEPSAVDWQTAIPADYRADKVWEPIRGKPLGDVLKGYAESQKLIGSSIRLPAKDAKPEDRAKWKQENLPKLGDLVANAPAKPEDYAFDRPEAALDLGWDEAAEAHMRGVWHKAGMSNDQVKAVIDGYASWQMQRLGHAREQLGQTEAALKSEWGAEYTPRIGRAARFVKETGAEFGIPDLLDQTGLGSHPNVVRWVAKVSQMAVEHGAMDAAGTAPISDDEANSEAGRLRTEMGKVNPGSPRMGELERELEALYKRRTRGA